MLGGRIFGGRPLRSRTHDMPWIAIIDIGVLIKLAITGEAADLTWTERWVRDRIIGRMPGGRHDAGAEQSEHSEKPDRGRS